MRRAMEWLDNHLWAYAVVLWVIGTGIVMLISPERSLLSAALRAVGMTAVGVGMLAYRRRQDSRAIGSGEGQLVSLDRQLQRGQVPEGEAGREGMRRLVAKRRHTRRHLTWLLPLWCLMVCGVGVLALVTSSGLRAWGPAVGCFVFAAWFVWMSRRLGRRLTAMEKALGAAPVESEKVHSS
ncbi:hypothetical protein ACIO3O_10150 [Streptomyces sp. NPDC087440]|uniref:hypothetical protein n=1 Tax=Streptomyces sp. NPDC087440 TaxID=3365790 RepID=UPI003810A462